MGKVLASRKGANQSQGQGVAIPTAPASAPGFDGIRSSADEYRNALVAINP